MTKTTNVLDLNEQDKYEYFVQAVLLSEIFISGSELAKKIIERFDVKDDYARQIIRRAVKSKVIWSSSPTTFGRGQYIYLLPGRQLSLKDIITICKDKRPPIYRLLQSMSNRGGIISYFEALKVTASPEEGSSTKVNTLKDIVVVLNRLKLIYETKDDRGINYILLKSHTGEVLHPTLELALMSEQYNKMMVDCTLIPDIVKWLNKSNLVDNVEHYRKREQPSFGAKLNGIMWDAYGYTKATGINPIVAKKAVEKEKQTPVVLDIMLSAEYGQLDLDAFLARIYIIINSVKKESRKVVPIIVYRTASSEVLNKIKALGLLAFDIASIFGTNIYTVLSKMSELNNLLLNPDGIESSVQKVLKVIRTSGQEDALKTLKGVLFETLMYPVLKRMYPDAALIRNKELKTKHEDGITEKYEYDYIFNSSHPNEITVVELKGYNSSAHIPVGDKDTKNTLKWFFERTLPFARKQFAKEIGEGKQFKGIYITSANFWPDGDEYILSGHTKKYKSAVADVAYDRKSLLAMLHANNFKTELQIIEKYYVKDNDVDGD